MGCYQDFFPGKQNDWRNDVTFILGNPQLISVAIFQGVSQLVSQPDLKMWF